MTMYGVDVTDPTRTFTDEEWSTLRDNNALNYLYSMREAQSGGRGGGRGGPGRGRGQEQGGRNVAAVETDNSNADIVQSAQGRGQGGRDGHGGRNGGRFGRGAYQG